MFELRYREIVGWLIVLLVLYSICIFYWLNVYKNSRFFLIVMIFMNYKKKKIYYCKNVSYSWGFFNVIIRMRNWYCYGNKLVVINFREERCI